MAWFVAGIACKPSMSSPNFTPDQLDLQLELPILENLSRRRYSKIAVLQPMTLAEQVAFIQDENDTGLQLKKRGWPWADCRICCYCCC